MGLDITAADKVLKIHYARSLKSLLFDIDKYPLWNTLDKRAGTLVKNAFGSAFYVPFRLEDNQSVSAGTPAAAETKAATSGEGGEPTYRAFSVTPKFLYSAGVVSGPAIVQTNGDTNAFVDALVETTDSALRTVKSRLALHAHGSGFAELGVLTADPGVTTVFSVGRGVKRRIKVGMDVVFAATLTGALRAGGSRRVTAVASNGDITVSAAMDAAVASGDFVLLANEHTASSTTPTVISGLDAWNPVTEPAAAESFFGVDRSVDYRLGGIRLLASDFTNVREGLIELAMEMDAEQMTPKLGYANPLNWAALAKLQEGTRDIIDGNTDATMGFGTLTVHAPCGPIKIMSDPTAPLGRIRILDPKHVYWAYAGPGLVHFVEEDGNMIRKVSGQDAFMVEVRSAANIVCDAPNAIGVLHTIT